MNIGPGLKRMPKPQQLRIADVCNSGLKTIGILLPRRSSKTTSLFALALGRCFERPGYQVAYVVCTTATKARDRFHKDIVPNLDRMYPDKSTRPFSIKLAGGLERIVFDNGSLFQILKPAGEAFRSDAFNLVILDEAGEADPETGEDLLAGILPTFDTEPDAQLIVTGTAAKYRDGNLLWDTLVKGRPDSPVARRVGILEYAAPDTTTDEELEDWDTVKQLVLNAHPGVDTLTDLDTIEERWHSMKRKQFAEEYLSIFGTAGVTSGVFNMEQWDAHRLPGEPPHVPTRFGLGVAVHPDQTSACIMAAWREAGRAKIMLLGRWEGTSIASVVKASTEIALKYRLPIVHDIQGTVLVQVEAMKRQRPRVPRLEAQRLPQVKTAAALLVKEVDNGNVDHWGQVEVTRAASLTVKRKIGNGWGLGRQLGREEDEIIEMEAAAMALRFYDEQGEKKPIGIITG